MAGGRFWNRAHGEREDLAGEHPYSDTGQIVLALVFGVVWVADAVFLKYTTFLNRWVPLGVRVPVGGVVLVLSGYVCSRALAQVFGPGRTRDAVIADGVFGLVRHPVYLGEILVYLGFLVLSMSAAAAAVLLVGVLFLNYMARYEEGLLLARFGEAYRAYMRDVPMWLPRLRRARRTGSERGSR
jgi:protein-S-isoprenylcysteine O-methyltransferase Ste14